MDIQKKKVKNICSLYASKWHLVIMLLPYLNKQIEKGVKIQTILKEDISENIEELIRKLNLDKKIEEKVLNINWKESEISSYEKFLTNITSDKNIIIILNGENKEVQENNKIINKWISKNTDTIKDKEITIISCFKALEDSTNVDYLINNYDCTLNTTGEHNIEEIFNIYKKVISY